MTREEAIKILRDCKSEAPPEENWVNAFVALGILKLDEPKSGLDLLKSRLAGDYGYSHSGPAIMHIEDALRDAGLQVVPK